MIKSAISGAVLTAAFASSAIAGPFSINVGYDGSGNGSTSTTPVAELGYSGTLATSFYLGNPAVVGTTVIDTNIASVMTGLGFTTGSQTTIGGDTVNFSFPSNPGGTNIDTLNFASTPTDGNGFVSGEGGFPNNYGNTFFDGPTWGFTYDYEIIGQTTATGVQYTDGYFDLFFEDGSTREQVLRFNVSGSNLNQANLDLFGGVSFDFDGNGTDDAAGNTFVQNLFVDDKTGKSFYELWLAGLPSELAVRWNLDTNVNPPLPSEEQLVLAAFDGGEALIRQTTLDGSVVFSVPTPSVLGLLGLGLLALGGITRRRAAV
jgi:hypothetical protein